MQATAMKRLAALLIVLTLTGSPAAQAACLTWCASDAAVSSTICHHAVAHAMSVALTGQSVTCTAFVAAHASFILERRATIHPPSAIILPPEQYAFVDSLLPLPTHGTPAASPYASGAVRVLRL
jgi:hypothetical protein